MNAVKRLSSVLILMVAGQVAAIDQDECVRESVA